MNPLRLVRRAIFGLILLVAVLATSVYLLWPKGPRFAADGAALVKQIQQLNELATVKYTVQKVLGVKEQKIPVGSESLLLIVQARVVAGIDLSQLRAENVQVDRDGVAVVSLPEAKILHVYLDEKETKVWDRRVTWWTPWVPFNPELETKARLEGLRAAEQAARDMGIISDAQRNAERAITSLLGVMGASSVRFRPVS